MFRCVSREMQCVKNQIGKIIRSRFSPISGCAINAQPASTLRMPVTSEIVGPKPVWRSITM